MSASSPRPKSGKPRKKESGALVAGAFGMFSIALIALSFPLFADSVVAQRSIETVDRLKSGRIIPTAELEAALRAIGPVSPEHPPIGDRLANQSILSLTLALRIPNSDPAKIEYLEDSLSLIRARLARAPADTHSWARLALAEYLLNGPSEEAIAALTMSHRTGPYEYLALRSRLELGLILWFFAGDDLKEATVLQAALLWEMHRDRNWLVRAYSAWPEEVQARVLTALEARGRGEAFTAALTTISN